jgi:rhamnulokinase
MSSNPSPSTFLAIDLGASSGRAVVGTLEGTRMAMREVHRFRTPLLAEGDHLYWDLDALWLEVQAGLARALRVAPDLRSVSVDSWGVDYVPLSIDGTPLRHPYVYRDPRTRGRTATVSKRFGVDALYARTGTQFLDINTLAQVAADVEDEPALVGRTAKRLMIADYFLFRFSGRAVAERTLASTTQLLDVRTGRWAEDVIRTIGDAPSRWPDVVSPGAVLGAVDGGTPLVLATCSHDTAAAVAAVPASSDGGWAFISSGTWSLVGIERASPILTSAAREAGFTNELGLHDSVRFLKNRTGLWVIEECLREWTASGARPAFGELMAAASEASSTGRTLDLDAPQFAERGGMPAKLREACMAQGIPAPHAPGGLVRLVLESLADGYRGAILELEELSGDRIRTIHVVGGGSRVDLLNQLTAERCNRRVVAGPDEATALGNLLVQAHALGELPDSVSVRDAARRSARLREYAPGGSQPVNLGSVFSSDLHAHSPR